MLKKGFPIKNRTLFETVKYIIETLTNLFANSTPGKMV